jgi:hypothetical protein
MDCATLGGVPVPARRLRLSLLASIVVIALIGCGDAAGGSEGTVAVAVTRDFGARPVVSSPPVAIRGGTPVLDVVDRIAGEREGTRTITSIEGVAGAWRLFVNGVRVDDAKTAEVRPGDRIWLDLPAGPSATAVVGAFPEPFLHGVEGKRMPTRVECADPESTACDSVARRLGDLGIVAARGGLGAGVNDETIRVLVGTWTELRATRVNAVLRVDGGPARSGVFARFAPGGRRLEVLRADGREAEDLGAGTGLVAATRIGDAGPVWLVTGTDAAGVEAAAGALDEATLTTKYALAIGEGRGVQIPAG